MDYCTAGPQYASGGYIADSAAGTVVNGSQQQWLTRNSRIGELVERRLERRLLRRRGRTVGRHLPGPPYTTLDTTPVSREKPYLFVDGKGRYQVRVPSATTNEPGHPWEAARRRAARSR